MSEGENDPNAGGEGQEGTQEPVAGDESLLGGEGEGNQGTEEGEGTPTPDETLLGQQGEGDDKPGPQGAPDQYEPFTVPEGIDVDDDLINEAADIYHKLGLSQEQAQQLVDLDTQRMEAANQEWAGINAQWVNDIKTDAEMGGGKFPETLSMAKKAMDKLGSDGLRDILNDSGLGNHPELVRSFAKMGRLLSEGTVHTGQPKGGSTDPAYVLFPSMRK